MTAAVRVVVDDPAVADAGDGWQAFLAQRLEPTWRAGEWNPDTLIFTGDPDNPKTFVYLCADPDCRNPNGVRNTLCPFCVARRKRRSRTLTRRFHDSPLEPCLVTVDEQRCERPRYSVTGLCFTHQSRYTQAKKTRGIRLDEFLTTAAPLGPLPQCAVTRCRHQVLYQSTPMCSTHHHQYRTRTENCGPRISQLEFAAQALPLIRSHEFTLAGCSATIAVEVLWILQERDRRGFGISILRMRNLLKSARGAATLFEVAPSNEHVAKLLRMTLPLLQRQRALFEGIDPTESDRWGPDVLERFPSVHDTRSRNIVIDWSAVGCAWLRRLGKTWALETLPQYEKLRPVLQALTWASRALETSRAFTDPLLAGRAEIAAIIAYCKSQTTSDGTPFKSDYPQRRLWELKAILAFCRAAGHMDDIPGTFVLTTSHLKGRPNSRRRDDDEPGKALPDEVVDILDRNLDRLRPSMTAQYRIQGWSNDDYGLLRQTIYQLLRDTGRRPGEVTALRRDCLDTDPGGGPVLIYTNSKAGRLDRRLHITTSTANLITTWLARISTLRPDRDTAYLFPQLDLCEPQSDNHFKAGAFGVIFRAWVDSIPELTPLLRTPSHPDGVIDRRDVVAYSLRHTYAQRHADAGTPVDVLAALLDHGNVAVTQGYYRVGPKRKREAIERVGALVMDRRGELRPAVDHVEYERRSVSTLLGGCVEPSNVKSGGRSCPIRFQCGGCDHYRPDPSYIPEIEQEIRKIKADVLEAQLCAAPQVVDNLRYNLAMFEGILAKMTASMERLDAEERAALDAAIGTIRRAREAHRNALPLFVIDGQTQDDHVHV
jgi:integrase